jgi:DNA-binding NarL/FixJ family response regulator
LSEIRVLLADDHAVVRRGLRLFLDLQPGIAVVGEAADGRAAVELARAERPDVVLMDLVMPELDGIEATRQVHEVSPPTKVLVLSSFSDEQRVLPALRSGADGYLTKDAEPEQIVEAVRAVHRGDPVFCAEALRRLTEKVRGGSDRPAGTVTILFTDVEGSTRLVEELGDEAARSLLRGHDALVRGALAECGGLEVEQEGDAFMLAFAGARPAVDCAVAIQRALEGGEVQVRIGLNTGDVIDDGDRYFGRTVFVAARVTEQARGGEILSSEVTKALAAECCERFVDRGEFELKGLRGKHRLYEVPWF